MSEPLPIVEPDAVSLIAAVARPMAMYFSKRVEVQADVQDLIAETKSRLVIAYMARRDIDDGPRFAFGTAKNVLHEYRRKIKRRAEQSLDTLLESGHEPAAPSPVDDDESDPADVLLALQGCLAKLNDTKRELITAFYASANHGAHRQALAEKLGKTLNALYIDASRIRKTLRLCVEAAMAAKRT